MQEYISHSAEETMEIGVSIGSSLPQGTVLCLKGDLAAGKTTLIKGIAEGLGACLADHVHSPTFVFLNIYEGKRILYHFDLYRLHDPEDFFHMGFDEMLEGEGVCCIEWSERIETLISSYCTISLVHLGEDTRKITVLP